MATSGIEPATFQFVAQYLNHCATAYPPYLTGHKVIKQNIINEHPEASIVNDTFVLLF
jgi:hypothetical protein